MPDDGIGARVDYRLAGVDADGGSANLLTRSTQMVMTKPTIRST